MYCGRMGDNNRRLQQEIFLSDIKKKCLEGIKALKGLAQGCCGVSTLGVIQGLSGHIPEQPDVC